jgi:outer membrane protein insertion porin family
MRKKIIICFLVLVLSPLISTETIEKILLVGNQKVSRDTVLFYMKSKENGLYSEALLREDFKNLWNTGFFENIAIESDNGTRAKIVKVKVKENLLISSVTYKTNKKIKENDILDRLQEHNIILTAFSYYSPSKMKKVEKIIKEMLQDKGFNQGKVEITAKEEPGKQQIALTIHVIRGPKTRIGNIAFPGLDTQKVSPGFLRRGMKHNKPHGILSFLGGKDVYKKEKIAEDLEEIKLRLQQKGYLEAKVGSPIVSIVRKHTVMGKVQKMMLIEIPVDTGPQYRVGNVRIEGNNVIKSNFLKRMVTLNKGDIYNIKKREKIRENLRDIYGSLGYIFCQVVPTENLDPVKKVADLTLKIHEGDVAYVGNLDFTGNTFTKDYVLRREWLLKEGSRLNMNALKACITRIRQLGLVDIAKIPEFKQDPNDPQKMDIAIEVKELNRQSINSNVGYSGYEGLFVGFGYSTRNFLGRGETLALTLQTGTRSKQYRLAFTEPYLFNLPASLGFSVHKTDVEYPGIFTRKGEGFSISTSGRIGRFYGASLSYSFENVKVSDVNEDFIASNPYYALYYRDGTISAISPTIYYSTVDSPLFPTSGSRYLFNYKYSGGFLGGNVNLHKTRFQFLKFIPLWKHNRHVFAIQLVHQALISFGGQEAPIYEKFFLGGENSIRGFDIYRISPRNANGDVIGGNKAFHLNIEYAIPLDQQRYLSAVLFYDVGNAYDYGDPVSLNNVYSSIGLELKIFVPMLNMPFRLIFAYNPRKLENENDHFSFRFAVGPSFQ